MPLTSSRPQRLLVSTIRRTQPARGPSSSQAWNDTFDEVVADIARLVGAWNDRIVALGQRLPDGVIDPNTDAFRQGLDGRTLYVDSSADSTAAFARYYSSTYRRPKTVREVTDDLNQSITSLSVSVQSQLAEVLAGSGLTDAQKRAIGINIFDSTQTSIATSIDGRSRANQLNILQLAKDLYDADFATVDGDSNPNLAASLRDMVGALLDLHGGAWNTADALSHASISNIPQTAVNQSNTVSDAYSGSATNLEDDLNRLRTRIRNILGTAGWLTNITEPFSGAGTSLQAIANLTGSASKSASNPWGYSHSNVDGLTVRLQTIRDFVGMNSDGDATPVYSSTEYLSQNTYLENAVSQLDNAIRAHREGSRPDVAFPTASGAHWDRDIYLSVNSGAYNLENQGLNNLVRHLVDPAQNGPTMAGLMFRRHEYVLQSGNQVVAITHNRGNYPIVQAVFFGSGTNYWILQDSVNQFTYSGQDVITDSGLVIALW